MRKRTSHLLLQNLHYFQRIKITISATTSEKIAFFEISQELNKWHFRRVNMTTLAGAFIMDSYFFSKIITFDLNHSRIHIRMSQFVS